MKLLHVHERHHRVGGAEVALAEAALGLSALGHENRLAYPAVGSPLAPRHPELAGKTAPLLLGEHGFTGSFQLEGTTPEAAEQNLASAVAGWRPDVVIVHNLSLSPRRSRLGDVPVVRIVHDLSPICPRTTRTTLWRGAACARSPGLACVGCLGFLGRSSGPLGVRFRSLSAFQRRLEEFRKLETLIVPSQDAQRHLILAGCAPERIVEVPLGMDLPSIAGESRGRLLFVGNLVAGKGADLLIDAVARTQTLLCDRIGPDFRVDIVGDGPERARLEQHAVSLGLSDRVVFHGRLEGAALIDRYVAADVVVCPSRTPETFGLVGLEAMALARPVVATPSGGCDAWLESGHTGIRAHGATPEALADALTTILTPPRSLVSMGRNGRALYRTQFTRAAYAERLEAVLEQRVTGPRLARAGSHPVEAGTTT